MDTITGNKKDETGSKNIIIGVMIVGALIIAGIIGYVLTLPSPVKTERTLENALHEGNSEFQVLISKMTIDTDDDRTTESPTAAGTIQMNLAGIVRNFTGHRIIGLELVGSVVDMKSKVVQEKKIVPIPDSIEYLENNKVMNVNVIIDGFSKKDDRAAVKWRITGIIIEK